MQIIRTGDEVKIRSNAPGRHFGETGTVVRVTDYTGNDISPDDANAYRYEVVVPSCGMPIHCLRRDIEKTR